MRTLNREEAEMLKKMILRGTCPHWLIYGLARGSLLDALMLRYEEQEGGFTICNLVEIRPDGSLVLRTGVSRKRDEDKAHPLSGQFNALRRALWAEEVKVGQEKKEMGTGRPRGMLRFIDPEDGDVRDCLPLPNLVCQWYAAGQRSLSFVENGSLRGLYYTDARRPEEIYAMNKQALIERYGAGSFMLKEVPG